MKSIVTFSNLSDLNLKFAARRGEYLFDLSKITLFLLLCLSPNFQTLANDSIYSLDSIPGFQEMYSYENIELIEYDFEKLYNSPTGVDTLSWGKKQFTILSKLVFPDSVIVDFDLRILSFIDNSITDTLGTFRIYSTTVGAEDSIPELSAVTVSGGYAHLNCDGNFSDWFEIKQCGIDFVGSPDSKFGRLLKNGDGGLAWSVGILEGLGYDHFELSGAPDIYIKEELVGFVQAADTTGIITDFEIISSSEELIDLDFSLSPNPVSDYLRLSINSGKLTIEITDATGTIHCQSDFRQLIDVSELESGIYFIRVIDPNYVRSTIKRFYKI